MEKIINIGDRAVKLSNNVSWAMHYRSQFGKDIVPALLPLVGTLMETASTMIQEADNSLEGIAEAIEGRAMDILLPLYQAEFVDTLVNVMWAMAKAADENIDPPLQWAQKLDSFPIDIIAPEVYGLAFKGFVSSKNLIRLKAMVGNVKVMIANLQPSTSTTSSSQEQSEG